MKSRIAVSVLFALIAVNAAIQSDAQKSFAKLKTRAISVKGYLTSLPQQADRYGKLIQISLRVTSVSDVVMHEIQNDFRNITEKKKGE